MLNKSYPPWLLLVLVACSNIWPTIALQINMMLETEHCRTRDAICPTPYCERLPTEEEQQAPGIGLALDMAHATAVVRFHNGSYQNVAFIKGDTSYVDTMASMAKAGYELIMDDKSTRIIAEMVEKLRMKVEAALNGAVIAAAVTTPDQIDLSYEEFAAILDLASIRNVIYTAPSGTRGAFYTISAVGAAYAGAGMGLCKDYTDFWKCDMQERCSLMHDVLQVDLSARSLSATIWERAETYKWLFIGKTFVNTTLGIDSIAMWDDEREQRYWRDVRRCIRDLVESFHPHVITYLLLTGTSTTNPTFRSILRDILSETATKIETQDAQQISQTLAYTRVDADPLWLTAQGAAEIAKRRQEAPFMCQPDYRTEAQKTARSNILKSLEHATRIDFNFVIEEESI